MLYNIAMSKPKITIKRLLLRLFLTIACAFTLCFIFSNSLKTGEESAAQSSAAVDTLQTVVGWFAPNSPIATATGEAYERLHEIVRLIAHAAEFALFGALLIWCYFSYSGKIEYVIAPVCAVILVPFWDEYLQALTATRASELTDVMVDLCGGIGGALFAIATVALGLWIIKKRRKKYGER